MSQHDETNCTNTQALDTQRKELKRLAETMTDEQLETAIALLRQLSGETAL